MQGLRSPSRLVQCQSGAIRWMKSTLYPLGWMKNLPRGDFLYDSDNLTFSLLYVSSQHVPQSTSAKTRPRVSTHIHACKKKIKMERTKACVSTALLDWDPIVVDEWGWSLINETMHDEAWLGEWVRTPSPHLTARGQAAAFTSDMCLPWQRCCVYLNSNFCFLFF